MVCHTQIERNRTRTITIPGLEKPAMTLIQTANAPRFVAFPPQGAVIMREAEWGKACLHPTQTAENRPFRYVNLIQMDEQRTRLSIFACLLRLSG